MNFQRPNPHYLILILLAVFFIPDSVWAQEDYDWSWATRGGGSRKLTSQYPDSGDMQRINNISIDGNNNYYFLAQVGSGTSPGTDPTFGNIPNDTIAITTYNDPNFEERDTYLVSTTCSGAFRWHKTIGGGGHIYADGLGTDELGGVYVAGAGYQPQNAIIPLHYDQDSIKTSANRDKQIYLIKYDTLGNFQWLREPQPVLSDPGWGTATPGELYVAADGTVHWMVVLNPGSTLENGAVVAQNNYFPPTGTQVGDIGIMRYDKDGNFLGYTRLDMDMYRHIGFYSSTQIRFDYDPLNERYLMVAQAWFGVDPYHVAIINGEEITGPYYLAAFDANTGDALWWHQYINNGGLTPGLRDVILDDQSNVYVTGSFVGPNNGELDEFAGYVFETGLVEPFCMKLDSEGQMVWVSYPYRTARGGNRIALSGNEVLLGQGYASFGGGTSYWGDIPFDRPSGNGVDPAIIRLDKATGVALAIDDIRSSGYGDNSEITALTVDKLGNIVVGGYMRAHWLFKDHPTMPELYKRGVNPSDFFIAQFAKDGVSCDDWLGMEEHVQPTIKLWPNPTTGKLYIDMDIDNANIMVYDIIGRVVIPKHSFQKGRDGATFDLSSFNTGVYFVRISTAAYEQTFKVIKE